MSSAPHLTLNRITKETEAATLPLPIFDSTSDAANAAIYSLYHQRWVQARA